MTNAPTPPPAIKQKPTRSPRQRKLVLGVWIAVAFIAILVAVTGQSGTVSKTSGSTTTAPSAKAEFKAWAAKIRQQLAVCTAETMNVQIVLGQALQDSSQSNLVALSVKAKDAQPLCQMGGTNDILDIGQNNPPSGYPTLSSFPLDLQIWADQDNAAVIGDVEKVANSNGSTASVSSLISDATSADESAATLENQIKQAAQKAGINNFEGLGLPVWGLQQK